MTEGKDSFKHRVWWVAKVLLWYFFYQVVCTYGFYAFDWCATWLSGGGREAVFTENALLAASLFLSALLMIWHLITFGYVKISSRIFSEVSPSTLVKTTALIFGSMYVLNIAMEWIALPDFMEDTFMELSDEPLAVVAMAVLAPIVEEMMFRGAIQGYLMRRSSNPWTGIIITAIIFGAIHMNPQQVVYATMLGIIFGWIYYRTRSLLPVIVGHVLNNSIAVASMKIWGTEDIEAITADDKMIMVPILLFIIAMLVPLIININRKLPAVPHPWREKSED
ncbi:MAG: CPBP family intramembrane metalloprotease [Bacteroidaceae bacterium]|nr:CPBP family intramembrane metalloprotease [Bacteroidaceae bacterium]